MNTGTWIIIFSLLSLLASCQVKESSGSGGLISGHVPSKNEFTVQSPTSKTYISGETLSFTLSFPFPVMVTGTPRLGVVIGSSTVYANYVSGNGSTNLVFSYVVTGADNDSDGVSVSSLNLNGGTLKFDSNGTLTDCSTAIAGGTYSQVLVDNAGPTISGFDITNIPGFYNFGEEIHFTVTFNETVVVTGSPYIALGFSTPGGATGNAVYSGGTGSRVLRFTYTIPNNTADSDGYTINPNINLNSGTIKDTSGNNSALNLAAYSAAVVTKSALVDFDGRLPFVVSVSVPAAGTYGASYGLDITVHFNRAVNVTGSPYIAVTIGSNIRQATYLSGGGSQNIIFRYVTVPGDVEPLGITVANTITQNSGTITGSLAPTNSYFTSAANNVFGVPSTTGVLINAVQPSPTSVARNVDSTNRTWGGGVDNVWNIGQQLLITVGYNTQMYVNQTSGTPRIPITIGSTTKYANYLSGGNGSNSLVFTYTVVEGDLDTDASIALGTIDLNGGTITDSNNTNSTLVLPISALATTSIDGVRPSISSVTPPANGYYSTVTGNNHANMLFTLVWSEPVNYSATGTGAVYFPINIGGTNLNANYTGGNNTASITHGVNSLATLNDNNGIAVSSPIAGSATIRDQAGNAANVFTFIPPNTAAVNVDTTAPTVTSVTPPSNGTYENGNNLDFVVNFSESVTATVSGGYPRILLTVGVTPVYLVPTAPGSGTSHTFRYAVAPANMDSDGIQTGTAIQVNGAGNVTDLALNPLSGTFTAPNTTAVLVNGTPASILSVTPPTNDTYTAGDVLNIDVAYSENITVTGTPRIQVTAQTGTLNFNYTSGSGTSTLTFSHTVTSSDFDFDGLGSFSSISLNGGTLEDSDSFDVITAFTTVNLASVFLSYPDTSVWTANNFTNRAPAGSIGLSSSGGLSYETCGSSSCRTFNGDDTLEFLGPSNGVETVFIVFKTPASLGNYDIFPGALSLLDNGVSFDLSVDGNINLDGSSSSGTTHSVNMATSSTHVLQIDFSTNQNFSGVVIPNSYLGAIGEVIMINGTLSGAQKSQVRAFINSKY